MIEISDYVCHLECLPCLSYSNRSSNTVLKENKNGWFHFKLLCDQVVSKGKAKLPKHFFYNSYTAIIVNGDVYLSETGVSSSNFSGKGCIIYAWQYFQCLLFVHEFVLYCF